MHTCDALTHTRTHTQVYRGLNIGAHKVAMPKPAIPLHMYDVADLPPNYTVEAYVKEASAAIAGVLERKRVPILFGGSPMYMEWLMLGCGNVQPVDRAKRDELEAVLRAMGWEAAKKHVRDQFNVEPDGKFEANDYFRLARLVRFAAHTHARVQT